MTIPTEDEIRDSLRKEMAANPKLKRCSNCIHYSPVAGYCGKLDKHFPAAMYGCKHHMTDEEEFVEKARQYLQEQEREARKVSDILTMALVAANMTTLYCSDLEKRVSTIYKEEKDPKTKRLLRKDCDMVESWSRASKSIMRKIEECDALYRHSFGEHLNKIFCKDGKYDYTNADSHLSDSNEFARLCIYYAKAAHHNEDNSNRIFDLIENLHNDEDMFALSEADINHYMMR